MGEYGKMVSVWIIIANYDISQKLRFSQKKSPYKMLLFATIHKYISDIENNGDMHIIPLSHSTRNILYS